MPFLKTLAKHQLKDTRNTDHVCMHILIDHCITYINVLNNSGTFLNEAQLKQLNEATQGVGMYLQLLRSRAKEAKQMLWWIQPKAHYMQHIPEEAKLINPKVVTCYIEESFIGKVAKVWISSKNGPYAETIQELVLLKYLVWLAIDNDL